MGSVTTGSTGNGGTTNVSGIVWKVSLAGINFFFGSGLGFGLTTGTHSPSKNCLKLCN